MSDDRSDLADQWACLRAIQFDLRRTIAVIESGTQAYLSSRDLLERIDGPLQLAASSCSAS